jgi:xylan 1,4-beta-xylosidase
VSLHQTGPFRNLNFDRVTFSGERMLFYGPNNTEQQTPLMPRFSDYFDASHQSVDWAFNTPGEWRVSDGSLLFEKDANQGQGERVALINEVPANNYIAEFNVAEFSTEDELLAGAVFNYVDEQNHGLILFSKDENKILVRFLVDGQSNYEQEALVTGVDNYSIFHAIRIQKENNHFSFYVDDMLKITAEEIMASGKLGLIAFSDKAKYGFSAFSNQFNGSSAFEVAKPAPGKFAATQYMKGGNGAGYKSDNQDINNYRYDNVAITNSQLNGLAVKAVAGEWFKYETMVASGGPYNVGIGCKPGSNGCKINLYQDDNLLGENISLPSITRNYREFAIEPVDLTAGASRIKVEVLEGEAEFTEFVFSHHTPVTEFEEPFDQRFRFAWNYDDGNWQLDNSNAYASGFGKRFMGYEGWTDYSVVTDIKYVSGMNAGIAFRAKNPAKGGPNDNPELGGDFFQGYFVTIEANRVVLGKHNYNYEFLAQKAGSYSIDTWYKLAVTVKGNSIKVFVDDMENPVIDYTDNTPFLNGKAGLRVFNSDVLFDNFMVTSQPLSSVTMAKSLVKDQNLTVFPNPTRGEIKIDGLVNNATVNIVNLKGTVLSAFPLCNDKTIDLSSFARGIYWLLITEDNKIHKKEIVVLH